MLVQAARVTSPISPWLFTISTRDRALAKCLCLQYSISQITGSTWYGSKWMSIPTTSVHFAFTKTSTLKLRAANALTLFAGAVILIVIYWHVYVRVLANKVTGLPGRRHIRRSKTVMPKH